MMDDLELDFESWLSGASATTTSIEILQTPALLGRYESWLRRYNRARAADVGSERSASDPDPVKALEAEGVALLDEIERSRSTWHVRALSGDDNRGIIEAHPDPVAPEGFTEKPPRIVTSPTEAQAKAFSQGYEAWSHRQQLWVSENRAQLEAYGEALRQINVDRGAEKIARAVVRVEQGGRVVTERVTAEQALALPARIGEAQVAVLLDAINRASTEVPEVPLGPLSHGSGSSPE